ncbi:cold adaptation protein AtcC [Shewanella sp. ENK2]|uniref:cold adaptation protein AtcC n=1 Tax=Shewanella sp. ENK2 TaxID=2775245 RepID=UPI00374A88BA
MQLALRDNNQGPYFSRVLEYGRTEERLTDEHITQIKSKAILMSLKLADKFYNKHKMHLLEQAGHDVIGVVSLGLIALTGQEPAGSVALLQTPDGVLKCFQKGWSMLTVVSKHMHGSDKSLYGDINPLLLEKISTPPDTEEWLGWQDYQAALQDHRSQEATKVLLETFYAKTELDPLFSLGLESVLAEAVLYRIMFDDAKVREDMKKRLRKIELNEQWFSTESIQNHTERALSQLPETLADAIRRDLGKHFYQELLRTLKFAKKYRELALSDASPEKLERYEQKHGLQSVLLGWQDTIDF